MSSVRDRERSVVIVRWLARIWSLLAFVVLIPILVPREPFAVQLLPVAHWGLLAYYGLSVLGLAIAWRWEGVGGGLAIAGPFGHVLDARLTQGLWMVDVRTALLWTALFILPGLLFLSAWSHSRNRSHLHWSTGAP